MDKFFNPRSIAIIGASNKRGKVGYSLVKNLKTFNKKVFYININQEPINNTYVYKSILDTKEKIDLAIIAIPSVFVPKAIEDCAAKKIKNIIIISAGFAEAGHPELQKQILETAKKNKIRILGPNCFGILNTEQSLNSTFASSSPLIGNISMISQSGALWSAIADLSIKNNIGFSKFASLGDMTDVGFTELLDYLNKDKNTKTILLYIEALKQGKEYMDKIRKSKKPVIVLKGGRFEIGKKATHSHTGSLAGSYEIYKAATKQAGAYFVETLTQALDLAKFLTYYKKPKAKRALVITNAGGPGILCTDLLELNNFSLPSLPKKLKFHLPEAWSHINPIDVIGDAKQDRYRDVLKVVSKKDFFDFTIIILTPQEMTPSLEITKEIVKFHKKNKKPVICCFLGHRSVTEAANYLEKNDIMNFTEIERMISMLKNLF